MAAELQDLPADAGAVLDLTGPLSVGLLLDDAALLVRCYRCVVSGTLADRSAACQDGLGHAGDLSAPWGVFMFHGWSPFNRWVWS